MRKRDEKLLGKCVVTQQKLMCKGGRERCRDHTDHARNRRGQSTHQQQQQQQKTIIGFISALLFFELTALVLGSAPTKIKRKAKEAHVTIYQVVGI